MATISLIPDSSTSKIGTVWRDIALDSEHTFFLSWPWIETWLRNLPAGVQPHLLLISEEGLPIGIGVLVERFSRRWGRTVRTWNLNTVGDKQLDQIFIENNGLLVRHGYEDVAWRAWASAFAGRSDGPTEIALRGIPPETLKFWRLPFLKTHEDMILTAPYADLSQIRGLGKPVVDFLGQNTRARVRSTRRWLEKEYGQVEMSTAATVTEALAFFGELGVLHQRRWGARGAFGNSFFEQFHTALIRAQFDDGVIQMIKVKAGSAVVALLYNFVYRNCVSMYQTGVNYDLIEAPNKRSPGLLTHAIAMQHNTDLGHSRYDFLAGDGQYKRAFSTSSYKLWWGSIRRTSNRFRLANLFRPSVR